MFIKNLFRYLTYQVFTPGTVLKEKYESFKTLLAADRAAHDRLAALEEIYYNRRRVDFEAIVCHYEHFAASVSVMVDELLAMCPSRYWSLKDYFKKFDFYVRFMLAPPEFNFSPPFVMDMAGASLLDTGAVGKKAAVLHGLSRECHLPAPGGFVITTNAFHYFMEANDLKPFINEKLGGLNIYDSRSLDHTSREIEEAILASPLPREVETEIDALIHPMINRWKRSEKGGTLRLAMRSSGVLEDGPTSFAGQYLSLMNLDARDLFQGYKRVIASKYSSRALSYRISCGIPDHDTAMAVLVLEMIEAEAAGVMYTRDINRTPETRDLLIHSAWGLGGLVVDGRVSPDVIRVDQNGREMDIKIGSKKKRLVMNPDQGTRTVDTTDIQRIGLSLEEADILTLARWGRDLEIHFSGPQDIEWCKDKTGKLFILQSRPLKRPATTAPAALSPEPVVKEKPVCAGARTICRGAASGPVFVLKNMNQLEKIPDNAIVAAPFGLPQYVTAIHKMAGIILEAGSTAGHFASVAREFGIPATVGPEYGFDELEAGRIVTLDAGSGRVYDGKIEFPSSADRTANDFFSQSPFMRKLQYAISFCAELRLTDPASDRFVPEQCRSLHDVVRFAHETALKEMFFTGQRKGSRKKGARQLVSGLPMLFYLLDVGAGSETGLQEGLETQKILHRDHLASAPLIALFKGLSHPGICWDEASHFDWEAYDKIVMDGGIISADSPQFGSYAVVSKTYMNVNLRFGYHFVILDSMCSPSAQDNYILFRFSGGGGNDEGRWLRADFIGAVLERLGFMTKITADLIDARLMAADEKRTLETLDLTGRLLGATKLMDMYLKDHIDVEQKVEEFMAGRYDFRTITENGD